MKMIALGTALIVGFTDWALAGLSVFCGPPPTGWPSDFFFVISTGAGVIMFFIAAKLQEQP